MDKQTIDGVDIINEGNVTHFRISEETKREEANRKVNNEPTSFWGKIISWFKTSKITPYVGTRDLADPFGDRKRNPDDIDAGHDGKTAVEIGIKFRF